MGVRRLRVASDHTESPDLQATHDSGARPTETYCGETKSAPPRWCLEKTHESLAQRSSAHDRPHPPEIRERSRPPARADPSLGRCCTCTENSACRCEKDNDRSAHRIGRCFRLVSGWRSTRLARCWAMGKRAGYFGRSDLCTSIDCSERERP